jgi:hypothetical protein
MKPRSNINRVVINRRTLSMTNLKLEDVIMKKVIISNKNSHTSIRERIPRTITAPSGRQSRPAITLAALKENLLRQAIGESTNDAWARLFRLAAGEAEALAWLTPFPLLFLPVLLEEKLDEVRHYAALQEHRRTTNRRSAGQRTLAEN